MVSGSQGVGLSLDGLGASQCDDTSRPSYCPAKAGIAAVPLLMSWQGRCQPGEGVVNWKDVFQALESVGGTEWYIVEEEAKSCQGFECIEGSIERLHPGQLAHRRREIQPDYNLRRICDDWAGASRQAA
jgi:sugar phosphate isomerase/epimerase